MTMSIASEAEFALMAERVRGDDPALGSVLLEPDGRYQTRRIRFDALMREVTACLAEGFRTCSADRLPTLVCAWGKSRVGSTALANLFGFAGLPSYYQPVKAIMRQCLEGKAGVPLVPPMVSPYAFSKETAGPYLLAECLINPFEALIEAGYPQDKLRLIVLDREPASSLASWINKLSHRVPAGLLVRHYVLAALNALRIEAYAHRVGVPLTHYVYEASKEPLASARALFARLGLADRFTDNVVTDWQATGSAAATNARVIFPTEPDIYDVPGLHHSDSAYRYQAGDAASLDPAYVDTIARFGIPEIYRASARACAADLGMSDATAARLFGADVMHVEAPPLQPEVPERAFDRV
jgi:hypothetical protein